MRDRQHSGLAPIQEEGNDAPAAADDIAITDDREPGLAWTAVTIAGHEKLVRAELGCPVEIDGIGRLIGGQRRHPLDPPVDGRVDDVFGPHDVGLDEFERIVLSRRYLFERRGVDHIVNAVEGALEPILVTYIAQEEAKD